MQNFKNQKQINNSPNWLLMSSETVMLFLRLHDRGDRIRCNKHIYQCLTSKIRHLLSICCSFIHAMMCCSPNITDKHWQLNYICVYNCIYIYLINIYIYVYCILYMIIIYIYVYSIFFYNNICTYFGNECHI